MGDTERPSYCGVWGSDDDENGKVVVNVADVRTMIMMVLRRIREEG